MNRFDSSDIASKVASEINDFNPEDYMDPKEARRNDRYAQLAWQQHIMLSKIRGYPEMI